MPPTSDEEAWPPAGPYPPSARAGRPDSTDSDGTARSENPDIEVFGEVDSSAFGPAAPPTVIQPAYATASAPPYASPPASQATTVDPAYALRREEGPTVPITPVQAAPAAEDNAPPLRPSTVDSGFDDDSANHPAYAKIAGRPQPASIPGPFDIGRILRVCAGVREDLLAWVPAERPRYTGLGGFVLLTALMAIGSSTIALMIAFHQPWYFMIAPAVFWGILIFNLDRWIVASPLPEHGWQRVGTILPRLLMAIVFGIVIAEPVVLKVFETEVTDRLTQMRAEQDLAHRSLIERCNPAPQDSAAAPVVTPSAEECKNVVFVQSTAVATAKDAQDKAQKAADASAGRLAGANAELDKATAQMNNECRGLDGSPHGNGPVCQLLTKLRNDIQKNRDALKTDDDKLRAALDTANTAVTAAQQEQAAKRQTAIDTKMAEYVAGRDQQGGLLERIEALNSAAAAQLSLLLAVWAVRLLLILVDSAPAIGKFTSGTTTYDRLVREASRLGEQKHRAQAMVEEERAQGWIDESEEQDEIDRARRRVERDRTADTLLLEAAQYREEQAARYHPVVRDEKPFGRAAYTLLSRVESAGVAPRPARSDLSMASPGVDGDAADGDGTGRTKGDEPLGWTWGPKQSISVVALGGPGSGKTTFLAQMYDTLSQEGDDRPFTLTMTAGGPRTHLENWAEMIRHPGSDWPKPTEKPSLTRYPFVCSVREHGVQRPILAVDYWDYPGEALLQNTELSDMDDLRDDLSRKVEKADALLLIVDGEDLFAAWNGDGEAHNRLRRNLRKIKVWADATRCPAQVVVTKWDVLENQPHPHGGHWTRARLIQALSTFDDIRQIAVNRVYRAGRKYGESGIRIIPVSVVGHAGSTQMGPDGPVRVQKARPVNLAVPFAGLLPDRLDQIYDSNGAAEINKQLKIARSNLLWSAVSILGTIADKVSDLLPWSTAAKAVIKLADLGMSRWMPSYLVERLDKARDRTKADIKLLRKAKQLKAEASEAEQVRDEVMAAFEQSLLRFERAYPSVDRKVAQSGPGVVYSPEDDGDDRRWV